jgi:release factor glutamine methyltransferase
MPLTLTAQDQATVVARLRTAGCVFAEEEAALVLAEASSSADLERMITARSTGVPLEHVLGWAEFAGLRIRVDSGVFVPRRRTEFLVQQALALARADFPPERRARPQALIAVDLCCGSGALGAAFAAGFAGDVEVYAADIDAASVTCARRNLPSDRVFQGDLYAALPPGLRGRVHLLLANTPYVPSDAVTTMPREARLHEGTMALDGGADGLDIQRRVAAGAPAWLAPGGHLLVEASEAQAPASASIFEAAGLAARVVHSEDWDATVVIGTNGAGNDTEEKR